MFSLQPAETDDDKIRRLSTAERQEQEEQPSSSLEIPGSYDDSSGVTEQPEPDILIIDHSDQTPEASDHRHKEDSELNKPGSAEAKLGAS